MYFQGLMGTFVVGIAVMLAIMGSRQWKMSYRIAGGLSLIVAAAIVLGGVAAIVYLL